MRSDSLNKPVQMAPNITKCLCYAAAADISYLMRIITKGRYMKNKPTFYVLSSLLVIGFSISNTYAQSAFAGFYGQVSTGYESNQLGNPTGSTTEVPNNSGDDVLSYGTSQNFGGAPFVVGLGYYWQLNSSWLLGLGADYSALSQTTDPMSYNITNAPGNSAIPNGTTATASGETVKLSNRFNLFISPAYVIDKGKLVYIKAGYSQVSVNRNAFTSFTASAKGNSLTTPLSGGPSQSSNQSGYLIGLGYKQIITSGLYGFIEVNYMGYSSPSFSWTRQQNRIEDLTNGKITDVKTTSKINYGSLNDYQLLIGLGYAF